MTPDEKIAVAKILAKRFLEITESLQLALKDFANDEQILRRDLATAVGIIAADDPEKAQELAKEWGL